MKRLTNTQYWHGALMDALDLDPDTEFSGDSLKVILLRELLTKEGGAK